MTTPFYQRLMRASGLASAPAFKPAARLAEVTAHIQRALGATPRLETPAQGPASTLDLGRGLSEVVKDLGGLARYGLEGKLPDTGKSKSGLSAMLARNFASETGNRP